MQKGDDELAREALKRRKSYQENADSMKAQLSQQRAATSQLIANTKRAPAAVLGSLRQQCSSREQAWMSTYSSLLHNNIHICYGRTLEAKLVEAKSKKDTLKARAKSAATSKQISDMLQGLNSSNAVVAFDRMEEKVMALESEAEATLQV